MLAEVFELLEPPDLPPRYNIAPTQQVPIVRLVSADAGRRVELLRWGLIPSWAQDPTIGARMINARAETLTTKPAFRAAMRQRRCLVLADGFYEWQKRNGRKQPFYVHLVEHRPFGFAGLWEHWESANGEAIDSCTVITTEPNELIAPVHDRMPAILHPEDHAIWLDPTNKQPASLKSLLRPYPAKEMKVYPVTARVNNPSYDGSECIKPQE